ncbi:hypothetical protein LMJF_21_0590 [Leishmania major strain Friedlin]|uniref:Uncharacterized protein n=1 Tax=Leishmania major TaxID=5664 RepID=Q4QCF6_LEIMA|nr:hypothetical protein LMJF_21_0590 [Leishmania major strain Friedlin]CAG9573345.1 hypothetical_protein_-_conserved [Leishmania major strain Friedlin]CAJ04110.1 hypothetical protein LMJF_21_0590 [Leishmania major strain Friedlin]|eukprot:XP_001682992.1 hypothetical protein LMJF_21_0590 [Leishmania major strain Friedlin]
MESRVPFSAASLAAYAMPEADDNTYMQTVVVPPQSHTCTAAAAAVGAASSTDVANDDYASGEGSSCYPLPVSRLDSGVASDAPSALAPASLISDSRDCHPQSPFSIDLPQSAPPLSWRESEETDVAAPAEIDHCIVADAGAEEDEAAKQDEAQTERCGANRDVQRLYMHPLAAAAAEGSFGVTSPVDPITAALARQQQQQKRGEPRSPLSSRTLQALYAACAEGRYSSFITQLTADDVLAPPPLALTWYPSVPAGTTRFADRKRTADSLTVTAMRQHEKSMLAEEEVHGVAEMTTTGAAPPLRRPRTEELAVPGAGPQPPSASSSVPACMGACIPPLCIYTGACATKRSDSADAACASAAADRYANPHRKRDRDERVYEYLSHGRRLR